MTKIATIDTRRFVAMVLIVAMLAAMLPMAVVAVLPGGVLGAENASVSGTFTVNDGSFSIDNVTVYTTTDNSSTTSMTPHVAYHVKVAVTNTNGLDNITQVNAILYYDSNGTYTDNSEVGSDNAQTHATFKWTPAGDFEIVGPSGKWACDNSSSVEPSNFAVTQGVFEFHVTVGDVATYARAGSTPRWFAYGSATNGPTTVENASSALTMQWYGAITTSGSLTWSGAAPGSGYTERTVSVTYVSNGAFNKQAQATSPWSSVAKLVDSDTPGANEFALKADDTGSLPGDDHRLVSTEYRVIGTGSQTIESPNAETTSVWLKIGSPFTAGTYNGTVYFQISNSTP